MYATLSCLFGAGFVHARQALYQPSHDPSPLLTSLFLHRALFSFLAHSFLLLCRFPSLSKTSDLLMVLLLFLTPSDDVRRHVCCVRWDGCSAYPPQMEVWAEKRTTNSDQDQFPCLQTQISTTVFLEIAPPISG